MATDFTTLLSPNSSIRGAANDAKQKIELLRAGRFNEQADVFEQTILKKIQNKDSSILGDFENLGQFYGANIKREGVSAAPVAAEENIKAKRIDASLNAFQSQLADAETRGVTVDPKIVQSIFDLTKAGDPDGAGKILSTVIKPAVSVQEEKAKLDIDLAKKDEERKSKLALLESSKLKQEAESKIAKIKRVMSQDISDVVGATEPAARFGRAIASELGAGWAEENQKLIKDLVSLTTDDVLERARAVAPVTDTDLKFLTARTAPEETDSPLIWKSYLEEELDQLEKTRDAFGVTIKGKTGAEPAPEKTLSATEKLRAKTMPQGNR